MTVPLLLLSDTMTQTAVIHGTLPENGFFSVSGGVEESTLTLEPCDEWDGGGFFPLATS